MATKKAETPVAEVANNSIETWNIYAKLALSKLQFSNSGIKKSGINRFAGFKYFDLEDIVPVANEILLSNGLVFYTTFSENTATGVLTNIHNPSEQIVVSSPMRKLEIVSQTGKNKMNDLQGLGAEETYQRRYLYCMLLDIVENDSFDATSGKDEDPAEAPAPVKPKTAEERKEITQEVTKVADDMANDLQKESIKKGLAKLREKGDHEDFITEVVSKMKQGATAAEAETIISDIGKLLYPEA